MIPFNRIPLDYRIDVSRHHVIRPCPSIGRQIVAKLEKHPEFLSVAEMNRRPALRLEQSDRKARLLAAWTVIAFLAGALCVWLMFTI